MGKRLERFFGPRVDRGELERERARYLAPALLLAVAALLLVVSIFTPYWRMRLLAPQYPGGLEIQAYLDRLEGDVREIDGLNHYIGMRPLGEAAQLERQIAIYGVGAIALLVVGAIFIHNRKAAYLAIPALLFPVAFLGDMYFWLRRFGQNLDPTAPLSSSIKPFVPPVLGRGDVGQFATVALPDTGLVLASVASLAILAGLWFHRRAYKPLVDRQRRRRHGAALAVLLAAAVAPGPAAAKSWTVAPGGPGLERALELAAAGDTVRVLGGTHAGPFVLSRGVELVGEGWPVLDGGGRGTVVEIAAPGAAVSGFVVRGSGASLDEENSGIAVGAADVRVSGNRLEDVLFGIYLRQAPRSVVSGNRIVGKDLPLARRGDAIRVWHSDGVEIGGNSIVGSRDVVLWYSSDLVVRGNEIAHGRYGLHFMYCDDAAIEDNVLGRNSVGAFLMYSRRLRLRNNAIFGNHGPSGYGVGLKDMDDAVVENNLFLGNRVGAFLDNSPRETGSRSELTANVFAGNDTGIVLLPNVRRAVFAGNDLVENQEQVELAGGGGDPDANLWRGNYWSDYAGYDADADGRGDVAYRAEKLFERLADRRPETRLWVGSPAAALVDFSARAFPLVKPRPKLVDPVPAIAPVARAGVPPAPATPSGGWLGLAAACLAAALGSLAAPRWELPGKRRGRVPSGRSGPIAAPAAAVPVAVDGLTKRFGRRLALDQVSFRAAPGEAVALVGPNGAGKTTALRALLGVVAYEGDVRIAGIDPAREGRRARRLIGFVPQAAGLAGDASVRETLEFFARLRDVDPESLAGVVRRLGLEDRLEDRVGELSGGLGQRLALAIALTGDPPILLLDEPTANLDAAARGLVFELLAALKAAGTTLIFTSHRLEEVELLADRVVHLEDGRVLPLAATGSAAIGALPARLSLVFDEPDRGRAASLLEGAGFAVRRSGPYLIADLPAERKVELFETLLGAGLRPRDFALEEEAR